MKLEKSILLVILLLFSSAWTAYGFLPTEPNRAEIRSCLDRSLPQFRQLGADEAAGLVPRWAQFLSEAGDRWMVARYRDDLGAVATHTTLLFLRTKKPSLERSSPVE